MKDNISLIAAAAGGFMLSLAAASIIKAAPIAVQVQPQHSYTPAADLRLQPLNPEEPVSSTLEQRFSLENSLERTQQIKEALASFRQLTEKAKAGMGEAATSDLKNTDTETQTLGFDNWVSAVEGTLKQQDDQIKQLEFELAQARYQAGKIEKAALDQKAADYQKSKQEFQAFWDSTRVTD